MIYYDKNDVVVRDARYSDVQLWQIDPHNEMRPLEVLEVWASDHLAPQDAVLESWRRSLLSYTIIHKNRLVGMFGIIPDSLLDHKAMVWLLTTAEIYQMRTRFLKLTRHFIEKMRSGYPVLYNWVDARNEQCIRWLKWAGAEVYPPEIYGLDKLPFHYFVLGGR